MIKCPVCGAHVPKAIAVEVPVGVHFETYCSLRCASAEGRMPSAELPAAPRRILVAVDGSGPSLRATRFAAALALTSGASVELIHAIDPGMLRTLPLAAGPEGVTRLGIQTDELEKRLRSDAEVQLECCREICKAAGVEVGTRVEIAAPNRAIVEAAEGVDLLVMGSRGLGATSGQRVGSLSQRVIAETGKPVLVVH